jgi:hypothetical protein
MLKPSSSKDLLIDVTFSVTVNMGINVVNSFRIDSTTTSCQTRMCYWWVLSSHSSLVVLLDMWALHYPDSKPTSLCSISLIVPCVTEKQKIPILLFLVWSDPEPTIYWCGSYWNEWMICWNLNLTIYLDIFTSIYTYWQFIYKYIFSWN